MNLSIVKRLIKNLFIFKSLNNFYNFFVISIILILCFDALKDFFLKANWLVISSNIPLFIFGNFPKDEQWRPSIWISYILILSLITILNLNSKWIKKNLLIGWIGSVPFGILLLYGRIGLTQVMSSNIGGLSLSILLTLTTLIFALPIGIGLAFCRQSSLFFIRKLSSIYIDTLRSIPLIAVLFFGQLLIPLFLPLGIEIDRVWRAIFAFTLFVSAYIAEDIRGGLQSIPYTQREAAKSLGLNKFQVIRFILIPQSLRIALPALTNQSIGLFQNTSLMSILGLVELLGIGRSILANPKFIGQYVEVYIWLACIYWTVCTIMAFIAKRLEKKLKMS